MSAIALERESTFSLSRDPSTYEVHVKSNLGLDDYAAHPKWTVALSYAMSMVGRNVVFINATMQGGGVAMLRPPLVHLLRLLGINAHWYVMDANAVPEGQNPFLFTKLMHNIIQRRASADRRISEDGKAMHKKWADRNADTLVQQFDIRAADVIVLDDPQPAPMLQRLREINPSAKIIWRNHVDNDGMLMDDPSTPQGEIFHYLMDDCGLREVDAYVFHPVDSFIPGSIAAKTFRVPATVDSNEDLNRDMTPQEILDGVTFINQSILNTNEGLESCGRPEDKQELILPGKPLITLIARFDESKGMDKAIELGVKVRERMSALGVPDHMLPLVVIAGNGSVDDPSGIPMLEKIIAVRRSFPVKTRKDIIVIRLPHNYLAINALMRISLIGMQTSEAEGLETRVTDWIRHNRPVVVSNRGGLSTQVIPYVTGWVLDFDKPGFDLDYGAETIANLLATPGEYDDFLSSMVEAAQFNSREFTTVANVIRWLRIFDAVETGKTADPIWLIEDMSTDKVVSAELIAR